MLAPETLLQNRYRVVKPLGQGGMGAVYEATDVRFGKPVAVKQAFFTADAMRRAFEREARLLNDLRHPGLPVVIDYFDEGNGWFLVMDFVPGEDLGAYLKRTGRPFAPDDVVRWADQVLDVLEYLHGHEPPIIHRDIKPQNLKLTPRGDVKLLDFGLAKGLASSHEATSGTSVAGYTPHYAPVEQIQGAGTDVRSDLYALGATMYHLLTGKIPPDALERAMKLLNGEPDPLEPAHELNGEVSPDVSEVLRRALATSPNQRPASASAMRRALREASGIAWPATASPQRATTPPALPETVVADRAVRTAVAAPPAVTEHGTTPAPPRRSRGRWIAAALGLLVLAAGGYGISRWIRRAPRADRPPRREVVEVPPPELRPLRFETLRVDERGAIAERRRAEAKVFVEDLGGASLELVQVPAGSFRMGAPSPRAAASGPQVRTVAFQQPAPAPRPVERRQQLPPRPRARPRPNENEPPRNEDRNPQPRRDRTPRDRTKAPPEPEPEPIEEENERPQRTVAVAALFVGRFEVTQAQWRAVAALPRVDRDLNADPSEFKGDSLPVDNVSWEDAVEFCKRLSAKTGREYRLPTEAEWEYACRAGSVEPFAFGATITPDLVNYDGGYPFGAAPRGVARRKTVPVGGLGIANAFGLSDMHGNVAEWCLDPWHADYGGAPADARSWEEGGDTSFRVLRGGSWINSAADCRAGRRVNNATGNRNSDVGFRIVMVPTAR